MQLSKLPFSFPIFLFSVVFDTEIWYDYKRKGMWAMQAGLVGKTLLIRHDGEKIPVLCFEKGNRQYHGMKIRAMRDYDNLKSPFLVWVGTMGLKANSVAMVKELVWFSEDDIISPLGFVSPKVVKTAKEKRERYQQRPAMIKERQAVQKEIAAARRKGIGTRGLNKKMRKINRALHEPGQNQSRCPRDKTVYTSVNPKPLQGGLVRPK